MAQIPIEKIVYDRDTFYKVVDNQFTQLINSPLSETPPSFTLEDFFELYEGLFFQIPREGDNNSHEYILQKTADYLGVIVSQDDIQALLDEITILRQQVLDSQTALNELSKTIK